MTETPADLNCSREMIFLSHANPEDNLITRWLALRLAAEGYAVWSDQTKLLGGEVFWSDIQEAIRKRTIKFLFLLSRASNSRQGALDELELALGVRREFEIKDFAIPLWLDDLRSSEFYIRLKNINAIPFQNWASGLKLLLTKLEEDDVPKNPRFAPELVGGWWREQFEGSVRAEPESLISNWYPLQPFNVSFVELDFDFGVHTTLATLPFLDLPHQFYGKYLVSFAPPELIASHLPTGVTIRRSFLVGYNRRRVSNERPPWPFRDERMIISRFLNDSWRRFIAGRNLPTYKTTNSTAFYFPKGFAANDRLQVTLPDDTTSWRASSGVKMLKDRDGNVRGTRHWHFGVSARATNTPVWSLCIRPIVLFSDDGQSVWKSTERLQRSRLSFCKNWWNDRYRDLNLAAVQFLADGNDEFPLLTFGGTNLISIRTRPLLLDSPVSYDEPALTEAISANDSDLRAEDDDEEFAEDDDEEFVA